MFRARGSGQASDEFGPRAGGWCAVGANDGGRGGPRRRGWRASGLAATCGAARGVGAAIGTVILQAAPRQQRPPRRRPK